MAPKRSQRGLGGDDPEFRRGGREGDGGGRGRGGPGAGRGVRGRGRGGPAGGGPGGPVAGRGGRGRGGAAAGPKVADLVFVGAGAATVEGAEGSGEAPLGIIHSQAKGKVPLHVTGSSTVSGDAPSKQDGGDPSEQDGGDPWDQDGPKKTGRKSQRQEGVFSDWCPKVEDNQIVPGPLTVALQLFQKYEAVVNVVTHNIATQTVEAMPIIRLSSKPTPADLIRFSDETQQVYLQCAPFSITVQLPDGTTMEVPVTPAKPVQFEERTYHVIVLARAADNAENELPSRFKHVANLPYDEGYGKVEGVYLHEERIPEFFEFVLSLDVERPEKIETTAEGRLLLYTSYVICAELTRLRVVKQWGLTGVTRPRTNRLKLLPDFPGLLRDWAVLCKLVFQLYLAIIEKPMLKALPKKMRKMSPFYTTMPDARTDWRERQKIMGAFKFFFAEKREMKLEWLCGEHITLLRHDYDSCNKLLMRFLGYDGFWIGEIPAAVERNERADVP